MRQKISTKAAIGYLVFCGAAFVVISTYTLEKTRDYLQALTLGFLRKQAEPTGGAEPVITPEIEKSIEIAANGFINITFFTVAILFFIALILLLLFLYQIYKPLRGINAVAKDYAKGDFTNKIDVRSNDELGMLAGTLNYMASELDSREEDQRKFISNVSHDFRSPLTSIKGYIEAMLDGTIPPEKQEKYLKIILSETERLNKLTQSILDLNRFGRQGIMLDISEFNICEMIRTTVLTFEGTCRNKNIRMEFDLPEDPLLVEADAQKIQQVLYNLIDNAVKFSYPNTVVYVTSFMKNKKVFVSVKDSGIGIPSDSIGKIWDRFYKTDLSRGKDKKGTGLGLAIVKEIIAAHDENINVVSTEGVGTEFLFSLPLAQKK